MTKEEVKNIIEKQYIELHEHIVKFMLVDEKIFTDIESQFEAAKLKSDFLTRTVINMNSILFVSYLNGDVDYFSNELGKIIGDETKITINKMKGVL